MMTINLQKGQKIDLTKTNPSVKEYRVGLRWNPNVNVGSAFDADVSAFILGSNGKRLSDNHFIFYNNLKSPNDSIIHSGDNRTGEGEGDNESLIVNFSKIEDTAQEIVFVVTIHDYEKTKQNFGQINGAYIRVLNNETNEELIRFNLNEDYSTETSMVFGKLYKNSGEWKFAAEGVGVTGGLQEFVNRF